MLIFNLSYHRNATTSFHDYMCKMQIPSLHNVSLILEKVTGVPNNILTPADWLEPMWNLNEFIDEYSEKFMEFIKKSNYVAYSDNPLPLMYKQLAKEFPDAKFILFKRNKEEWLNSIINYFGDTWTHFRRILYDSNKNPTYWSQKYESHNNDVINYFKENGLALLVIDLDTRPNIEKELNEYLNIGYKKNNPDSKNENEEETYSEKCIIFPKLNCTQFSKKKENFSPKEEN